MRFSADALRIRVPINTEMKQRCTKMKSKVTKRVPKRSPNQQKGAKVEAKSTKRVPKWMPKRHKDHQKNPCGKEPKKALRRNMNWEPVWPQSPLKIHSKINLKLDRQKVWKIIQKGSQVRAEIGPKTHSKSIQKLIANKGVEIMKIYVFLQCQKLDFERRTQ